MTAIVQLNSDSGIEPLAQECGRGLTPRLLVRGAFVLRVGAQSPSLALDNRGIPVERRSSRSILRRGDGRQAARAVRRSGEKPARSVPPQPYCIVPAAGFGSADWFARGESQPL